MDSASQKTMVLPATAAPVDAALESARVQALRGAACMLLVAYHVIGDNSMAGLRVADDSAYRLFAELLNHLRMPLFTFLSGFVYAYRPIRPGKEWPFAKKKVLRLYVPLITVSTLYFMLKHWAPGTNSTPEPWSELWRIYFMPYAHFWFLQAVLLIFAAVGILDRLGAMRTLTGFAGVLAGALLLHFFLFIPSNVFSSNQALYLFPFFLVGLGVNRFNASSRLSSWKYAFLIVFIAMMVLHTLALAGVYGEVAGRRTLAGSMLSLSGLLVMLFWTPPNRTLAWIGAFSFTIYLYHVFFTSAMRSTLYALGLQDLHIHFIIGCVAGIAGPIVVEMLFRNSNILSRLFLGQSGRKDSAE